MTYLVHKRESIPIFEAVELVTSHPGHTGTDNIRPLRVRMQRSEIALECMQTNKEVARTLRYLSEEPSKQRWLSGTDIDPPDWFDCIEETAR